MSKTQPEEDLISIGKIKGVHGLEGNVTVFSDSGLTVSYEAGSSLIVRHQREDKGSPFVVAWAKPHKKGILLKFEGMDRQTAETWVGADICIRKSDLPDLEEDAYYWFELIGLEVYTTGNEYLGVLSSIIPTGGNDVYVVQKKDAEILLPAISSVIHTIDPEEGRMTVTLPEGLS